MVRFRHFRTQLLLCFVTLVVGTAGVAYVLTQQVSERNATAAIARDFENAATVFLQLVVEQNARFGDYAAQLGSDYALKRALADADTPTLQSALASYLSRSQASVVALVGADGQTLAHAGLAHPPIEKEFYAPPLRAADDHGLDRALCYPYLDGQLHALAFAPVRAPDPIAWLGLGYRIDHAFAQRLKNLSRIDVAFIHEGKIAATTLTASQADAFAAAFPTAPHIVTGETRTVRLAGERWLVTRTTFPELAGSGTEVLELSSLDALLAPTRAMLRGLLFATLGVVVIAIILARRIARSVSEPIHRLAAQTRQVAAGDYSAKLTLERADELGQLATAFNDMTAGLAERDRVRDLLDKNVSPEIAAQLLRDGGALGGEEREVTILFADLRGFTSLSENLPPRELLALLNRYLDRMSAEIEARGGVIDKFIGDAIMALFGAPVAQSDAADRALAAAVAMEAALADLNRELATEFSSAATNTRAPHQLALGIGVNTARVVAGNIGSHRRLNYSVIGDGVNVASRLQSLTRTPEYRTNIITSAATVAALRHRAAPSSAETEQRETCPFQLRPLGRVPVKGRSEPVQIFAIGP